MALILNNKDKVLTSDETVRHGVMGDGITINAKRAGRQHDTEEHFRTWKEQSFCNLDHFGVMRMHHFFVALISADFINQHNNHYYD